MKNTIFSRSIVRWELLLVSCILLLACGFKVVLTEATGAKQSIPVGPEKPAISQMMMRMSGGSYSLDIVAQASKQHQTQLQLAALSRKNKASSGKFFTEPQWQLRGPTEFMGRVTAIVADPAKPDVAYVGAALGGVWKTVNGGASFNPIFEQAGSLSIGALALDPSNAEVIYVGTGEANPGGGSVTNLGDGLWRSSDGGQTWQHLGLETSARIGSVVINPNNPSEIFVAAVGSLFTSSVQDRGVFRSRDGGQTWTKVLLGRNGFTGAIDVQMDPQYSNRLYAVMWEHFRTPQARDYSGFGSGIWMSDDSGDNWSQLTAGLPATNQKYGRIGFAIAPSDAMRLYAYYSKADGSFHSFYRSDDRGVNWNKTNGTFTCSTYCWWFGKLSVSPTDKNHVFAHSIALYSSLNGGNSFSEYRKGFHVDHHAMWFSPNANIIYEGNDGGVYRSANGGNSYRHLPLPISQFYAVEVDPVNHNKILGGLQDNGSGYTTNGSNWTSINGGDGFTVLVDNTNTRCIYSEYQYGGISTSCGGSISLPGRKPWHTQMVFDESDNTYVYYGTESLHRSHRSGNVIEGPVTVANIDFSNGPYSGTFKNSYGTISSIHVPASGSGNTIYLGTDDGNVWVSTDRAVNWRQIDRGLPKRWVTRVTADPQNDAVAYVSYSGYRNGELAANVFRTTNHGESWANVSSNLPNSPVADILIDPDFSSTLYAANDFGVYVSYNTGQSWSPLGEGIAKVLATDLKIIQEGNDIILYAGTYGRGIYSVRLNLVQRGDPGGSTPVVLSKGVVNNVPDMNIGESTLFQLSVPPAATTVTLTTAGGTGNGDLYVKYASRPTDIINDCQSTTPQSNEHCQLAAKPGEYYARVLAKSATKNLTIVGDYTIDSVDPELKLGVPTDVPDLMHQQSTYYWFDVPVGAKNVVVATQGSNGDLDVYVKKGQRPTQQDYNCRSISSSSNETCKPGDSAGVYHVMVYAYREFQQATIRVDFTQ